MPHHRGHDLAYTTSAVSATDRTRRALLLVVIVAVHVLVVLWLATCAAPVSRPRPDSDALLAFDLPGAGGRDRAAVQPTRMPLEPPIALPPLPTANGPRAAAVTTSDATTAAPGIGGCALAKAAGEAIARDPSAMAELDELPPQLRSSADAVMLWNGQWLGSDIPPPGPDTASLRHAVEQVVVDAPPDCRNAPAQGPQFIPVPRAGRTVMIVVGSGAWRWDDLIADPAQCVGADPASCPAVADNDNTPAKPASIGNKSPD